MDKAYTAGEAKAWLNGYDEGKKIRTSERNIQTSDKKETESARSLWRKRQNSSDINSSQERIRIINETKFFEWWNGDELVDDTGYEKGTPIYWAMQGWQAANKEPWVKTYSGGKPNYTQLKEWISLTDDEIADVFGDYMDSMDETEEEEHNWDYERLIEAKVKEKNGYLKEEK